MRVNSVVASLLLTVSFGCGGRTAEPIPSPIATFDFTPPSSAAPNSAGVSFAIVNGRFAEGWEWSGDQLFTRFATHLGSDFYEALAARGFTSRGPFQSYDEMTFPERQNSDLVLEPNLDLQITIGGLEAKADLFGGRTFSGSLQLTGRVNIIVRESLSNERMWVRSIDVLPASVDWKGRERHKKKDLEGLSDSAIRQVVANDPGFRDALIPQLTGLYDRVMQTAWKYLDPDEMALVKQQAQEVRSRWVSTTRR